MRAVADRAGARPQQRGQHRQQRGLAGAVRPEQAEDGAARGEKETRDTARRRPK